MPDGKKPSWHYLLLWFIVIVSFGINVALFLELSSLRNQALLEVNNAGDLLQSLDVGDYELPIQVNETVAISMTVPFSDTFVVPISTTVPVSGAVPFQDNVIVPINTVIPVNTTVSVPVPAIGNITIPIPIVTSIPVNMSVDVPISRTIPVQLDIPVNLVVEVPVQSEVPIRTEVPINLDFPVTLPLNDMGIQQLLLQVQEALDSLARLLEG